MYFSKLRLLIMNFKAMMQIILERLRHQGNRSTNYSQINITRVFSDC